MLGLSLSLIQEPQHETIVRFHAKVKPDAVIAGPYNVYAEGSIDRVRKIMHSRHYIRVIDTDKVKLSFRKNYGDWLLWVAGTNRLPGYFDGTTATAFTSLYTNETYLAMHVAKACNIKKVICLPEANDPYIKDGGPIIKANPEWDSNRSPLNPVRTLQ